MKHILKVAALAFILTTPGMITPSMAQDLNCETETSQAAMNECSWREYEEADKQLNAIWKLIKQYAATIDSENAGHGEKTTASKDLLNGQRGWIKYRDGHCGMIEAQFAGGTIRPQVRNTCLANLTNDRSFQFAEILKER